MKNAYCLLLMISTTLFLLHFYTHAVIGLYLTYTVLLEPTGNFISYTITVMEKISVGFDNASIIPALIFSNKSVAFFPSYIVKKLFSVYQVGSILGQIDMVEPKE